MAARKGIQRQKHPGQRAVVAPERKAAEQRIKRLILCAIVALEHLGKGRLLQDFPLRIVRDAEIRREAQFGKVLAHELLAEAVDRADMRAGQ